MSQNILDRILETKRKEVQSLRESVDLPHIKSAAASAAPARNFFKAIINPPARLLNLIAEVKKASPSAGVICEDFDPVAIAKQYEAAGASAISVLTDEQYFKGSLDYLRAVRDAVDVPVLRKDFIIDEYQVYQSRAAGADAILLIAAALPPGQLLDLMILAADLKMTCLVEVHSAEEFMTMRSVIGFPRPGYSLLGINNRDLTTFNVDIFTTTRLTSLVDDDLPVVSESGIKTRSDVERLKSAGVSAVLVGETLMRAGDIATEIENLLGPVT